MKNLAAFLVAAGLLGLICGLAWAQEFQTFSGVVAQVRYNQPKREGGAVTVQLVVQTDQGNVAVQVAPAPFLERQQVAFAAGERLDIRGWYQGGPKGGNFIAVEIWQGGRSIKLRNEAGDPLWGGGKRQRGY